MSRLLLCAAASGSGKTTVTCALLEALRRRGVDPMAFKCGPDYIDPMFHSEIIGVPSRNLDLFFLGEDTTRRLLWQNSQTAGVAVIEGVMGYYDGIGMGSDASAYHLAKATQTPAVLVVDGRGSALSLSALIKGFCVFRADSGLKGVILNRVSPMLYPKLKRCIEAETGVTVYGFLPDRPDCVFESRHLGLVTAAEVADLKEKLDCLAEQAEKSLDLNGLLDLAKSAPALAVPPAPPVATVSGRPIIAVARDSAFCFYYSDALALLEELGGKLIPFSPLTDTVLPEGASGLLLGGGYPELYARELSENGRIRQAIQEAVTDGMPCIAECGGFLYLQKTLEGADGVEWPMAGVFPARGFRAQRLQRFGYVTLTAQRDNLLCEKGQSIPAHEFHYWESEAPGTDFVAQKPQSDRAWRCAYATDTLYAGFPHFHLCARPATARRFLEACAEYTDK